VGIDLGGTKIEAIALASDGRELARERVPTPHGDYDATVAAIVALVARVEDRAGSRGSVGVGIPGAISATTGLVKNANSTWLIGRPLDRDLARALDRPVRVENDANCFALSDGAGVGARLVFGVILGTGVGGGIVVDGRVRTGANAIAGEWGHNGLPRIAPDDLPLPACYCGRHGCIETYLSGPALLADHRRHDGIAENAIGVVAAAENGDPVARATMARYVRRLGRALASVVNVLDPDAIVLGGGLSNVASLARDASAAMAEHVFSDAVVTRIVRNAHGDSSGVRGAAWLWPADHRMSSGRKEAPPPA
jgi:fructokinase